MGTEWQSCLNRGKGKRVKANMKVGRKGAGISKIYKVPYFLYKKTLYVTKKPTGESIGPPGDKNT